MVVLIVRQLVPGIVMWLVIWWTACPAQAYEVVTVEDGGTISGTVTLKGQPPEPKGFNLIMFPDPEYCGRISNGEGWRLLRDFTVGPEGQFMNVVVVLEGVEAGKPFTVSVPRVVARDCQFLPFMAVVRNDHGVEVINMDPVMHDVQAYETSRKHGARVLFNSPLPMNHDHQRGDLHARHDHMPGKSMVQQFHLHKGRRTFVMQCGFHAYMESWAFVINNPYYAITDADGTFRIDQVPPGTYRLRAWHPGIKARIERTVTVEPGGVMTVGIDIQAPLERRSPHTVRTPPRFGPGAIGRPSLKIRPLVRKQ